MIVTRLAACGAIAAVGTAGILMLARNSVGTPVDPEQRGDVPTTRNVSYVADCAAPGHQISPLIYGVGGEEPGAADLGAASRRWGGNPTTRYNWQLNTVNLTKDWFFKNAGGSAGGGYRRFL